MKTNSNKPLRVEVKNGMLMISIGVETLSFSAEQNNKIKTTGYGGFAVDVKRALESEDESGATITTDCLDSAIRKAIDSGSAYIIYV